MVRTELESAPNMAQLFAKAALTARGRGGDLPDTRLARTGVRTEPGELAAYARVCRFDLGKGHEEWKQSFKTGTVPLAEGSVDLRPLNRSAQKEK